MRITRQELLTRHGLRGRVEGLTITVTTSWSTTSRSSTEAQLGQTPQFKARVIDDGIGEIVVGDDHCIIDDRPWLKRWMSKAKDSQS